MYSTLRNPHHDPSEIKLTERQNKVYKCAAILICLCLLPILRNVIGADKDVLHIGIVLPIGLLASIFHECLLFLKEIFHLKTRYEGKWHVVIRACFKNSLLSLLILFIYIIIAVLAASDAYLKEKKAVLFCLLAGLIMGLLESIRSHSNGALNSLLKSDLPQMWAEGAFGSFYQQVLENFESRVTQFEHEHSVFLALKKLVLVVPLSCDVRGTFDERHQGIEYIGDLPIIVTDQGANMNRRYKNPVYKMTPENGLPFYLAMEQPAPILTICKMKGHLNNDILRYQRDSFISKLQEHFEELPGIVLVYDDTIPRQQVPLATFLKDAVDQES